MSRNVKISLSVALAGFAVLLVLLLAELGSRQTNVRPAGDVAVGGPFTLTDQAGRSRSERDFAGRPMLVYFGFTHCPDVCPMSLDFLGAALERLETQAPDAYAKLQPLFISVDPQRDTVPAMAEYLAYFHPKITGLTGTPAQIDAVTKAYRVYAARAPETDANGHYTVDHSSFFYLMDGGGKYLAHFDHNLPPEELAARLARKLR